MTKICFLILHYKSCKDTVQCLDSILALKNSNQCSILVLDNGSNNGSFEKLYDIYEKNNKIMLYKWDKGQGFSRGNNFLYQEARKQLPDFIVIANNDIVFKDDDFINKLQGTYDNDRFDILGPDICLSEKQIHQNPMVSQFPGVEYLEREIKEQENIKKHIYMHVLKGYLLIGEKKVLNILPLKLQLYYKKIRETIKPQQQDLNTARDYKNIQEGCVLCGACLICSSDFIENNLKVFEPETDFYYEEYLLRIRCEKMHMIMRYDPSLQVEHRHGASTRYAYKDLLRRQLFITNNMIKSGKILLSVLKEENNTWN